MPGELFSDGLLSAEILSGSWWSTTSVNIVKFTDKRDCPWQLIKFCHWLPFNSYLYSTKYIFSISFNLFKTQNDTYDVNQMQAIW